MDVLFLAGLVTRSAQDLVDGALAPAGVTAEELGVYAVLASGDVVTPGVLSRWLAAPPTTVSTYVRRLEARGHVVRERDPEDGRSYRLHLTAEGRAAHAAAAELYGPLRQVLEHDLGADLPQVEAALLRLRAAVDGLRGGPGPG